MKITINDVNYWDRDIFNIETDGNREGFDNVMPMVYFEAQDIEKQGWPNLPFTYEIDFEEEDSELVEDAIDEYVTHHTDYCYHRPFDVDYEIEH